MPGTKKKIEFGWYDGKFSHLNWLLPLLPECTHYCEPFSGSAAVLLNREPSPVETYNDIDSEVVNFFRVLRDHQEELIYAIGMTPFSREEFNVAIFHDQQNEQIGEIERARRFFVRARQVAHKVIVPFDQQHNQVLGGSKEPYVNNPLRYPGITLDYRNQQRKSFYFLERNIHSLWRTR